MAVSVEKTKENNFLIVLEERFDFGCVEDFRSAYESIEPKGSAVIILDFKHSKYMDSSALGMLINAKSFFSSYGDIKIQLIHCNEQIKKIFTISRFDKKFDIV